MTGKIHKSLPQSVWGNGNENQNVSEYLKGKNSLTNVLTGSFETEEDKAAGKF